MISFIKFADYILKKAPRRLNFIIIVLPTITIVHEICNAHAILINKFVFTRIFKKSLIGTELA